MPGWPEFAFWTASIDSVRIVLTQSSSSVVSVSMAAKSNRESALVRSAVDTLLWHGDRKAGHEDRRAVARGATPEQYEVLRKGATERAVHRASTVNAKDDGIYRCAGCGAELFSSDTKFDSGTGWPSFTEPAVADAVETRADNSLFMRRTEVVCRSCGGHLGHVFDDGPRDRAASATASTPARSSSTPATAPRARPTPSS